MNRPFLWIVALAAATTLAFAAPPSDIEGARRTCEAGNYREAIARFDEILAAAAGTGAAAEADDALDLCVQKLAGSDEADDLLREIFHKYDGRPAGLKALAALALSDLPWKSEDCRKSSPYLQQLLGQYGRTREAAHVIIVRAFKCLGGNRHVPESLADLEGVATSQKGNPEGAMALWRLGQHYREREDRDRAAIYLQRIIDEYPETIEYPYPPGLKIGKDARTDLELLHTYSFSPLFDRLLMRIDKDLLQGLLGMGWSRAGFISGDLLVYLVSLAALALALLPIVPLRRRRAAMGTDSGQLLVRPWSLWGAAALFAGFWTVSFLSGVLTFLLLEKKWLTFSGHLQATRGLEILLDAAVLLLVLRREALARMFRIEWNRLLRLALAILGAIVGAALLSAALLASLRWLGLVGMGPDTNHYESLETSLSLETWTWKIPLVILGATVEEVLFRGVLHDALRRRVPPLVAALLGSFVFSATHVRPLAYAAVTFSLGLVLVALRERFRSLAPGTILHALWNFLLLAVR